MRSGGWLTHCALWGWFLRVSISIFVLIFAFKECCLDAWWAGWQPWLLGLLQLAPFGLLVGVFLCLLLWVALHFECLQGDWYVCPVESSLSS